MRIRTLVRRARNGLVAALFDRPLPPITPDDLTRGQELRDAVQQLPPITLVSHSAAEQAWLQNRQTFRERLKTHDLRQFIRWDVVDAALFWGNSFYLIWELLDLSRSTEWTSRWKAAIVESPVGHPIPFFLYPKSSGNLIQQAYHLMTFENVTNRRLKDVDLIFEFGGGYGSLCRLVHSLGFNGRYIIYDFPEFSLLQRYYLKANCVPCVGLDDNKGVFCVSDFGQLRSALEKATPTAKLSMFIATWSLSETPVDLRRQVLPLFDGFSLFLATYQRRYGEVDNVSFFREWTENRRDVRWFHIPIRYKRGDYYLFGSPR